MPDVTLPANLLQEFQDAEAALNTASTTDQTVNQKKDAVAAAQKDLTDTLTQANNQHSDANTKAAKLLADMRAHFNLNPEPAPAPTPAP